MLSNFDDGKKGNTLKKAPKSTLDQEKRQAATELAAAFSHFTYVWSAGALMVVDVQGVDYTFTDPQIHTVDGKGFGLGNKGMEGMQMFIQNHKRSGCNRWCADVRIKNDWPAVRKKSDS